MQGMAAFMEQRDHIVMREQGWSAWLGRREVASEVDDGCAQGVAAQATVAFAAYPGPALLALARIEINIHMAAQAVVTVHDGKCLDIRVPGAEFCFLEVDAEQS